MKEVIEKLMKQGEKKADQLEAYASENRVITIRLATNEVVEAKEIFSRGCSVRFVKNKSVGFSSINDLREVDKLIGQAEKLSLAKDPDPYFKKFPDPIKIKPIKNLYDKKFFDVNLEDVVEWGKAVIDSGLSVDSKVDISGSINLVAERCWIKNSNGIDAKDVNTFFLSSFTVEKGEENSALGEFSSRRLKDFKGEKIIQETVENLKKEKEVQKLSPRKYKIVFGTHAVAQLLEHVISYAIMLGAVDSGFSYLSDKLNKKIASEKFTLIDDGRNEFGIGAKTIDDEGTPTSITTIIEKGVLKNFIGESYYVNKLADKIKTKLTGNAFRFGAVPGRDYGILPSGSPTNLVVKSGDYTDEELLQEIKEGIYVGRIWYTYPINPTVGEFSCTNRSDSFWIEDGEIKKAILPNSFRINDNILNLLNNIIGIGKKSHQSVIWGGTVSSISPAIGFDNVNVSYSKN